MAESPLVQLFAERKIRFRGDANDPLICAKDVAIYIDDAHYDRVIRTFERQKHVVALIIPGEKRSVRAKFLTERGLYRYLLQSKRPKALEFQEFVCELLITERKRVIDEQRLQAKIKDDEKRLRIEALLRENDELKNDVQGYKVSLRASDWLLTRSAVELEKGFKRPDATWEDLAVYYIKRFNREMDKKVLDPDVAQLDTRLRTIAREAFDEPLMHYDGYAVFAKKAQELEEEFKRGGKKDRVFANVEIDWVEYEKNLKLMQADSARQRAARARGEKLVVQPIFDVPQA